MKRQEFRGVQADELARALKQLDLYALNSELLEETRKEFLKSPRPDLRNTKGLEHYAKSWMSLAFAMKEAGRISRAGYIYLTAFMLIHINEQRCVDGEYDAVLEPITSQIRRIEHAYGLTEDETWPSRQGPKEYEKLDLEYIAILDQKQAKVFYEFGKPWLAKLLEDDRDGFYDLIDRGREDFLGRDDQEARLAELVDVYEREARSCSEVGAFHLACASLGAAMEARILLHCVKSPEETRSAFNSLKDRGRYKSKRPIDWDLNTLLLVCTEANWLSPIESELGSHLPEGWGHYLRKLRNLLHPGIHLKAKPTSVIDEREFTVANAAYVLFKSQIG